jgi:peptide chain release factor subunit 1
VPTASQSSSRARSRRAAARDASAAPRTLRPLVEWLSEFGDTDHWVVSCYLKLEPRDRERGKYVIKLKNRIRDRLGWLETIGVGRTERQLIEGDLNRIREYLEDPGNLPVGRGIAVFACEPLALFEAVSLPHVFRSRLAIDHSPLVRELAALEDEFGLVICAVYDRQSARFFQVTAVEVVELASLAAVEATRPGRFRGPRVAWGRKGSAMAPGEHNYHQRIKEEKHRHYARIAERLAELTRGDTKLRGIVIAGVGNDVGALEPHLHPYVAKLVLGTAKLNPKTATPATVMQAVLDVRHQAERQWERQHVAALQEARGTGWAVEGIEPVLTALSYGQVRTLLVDPAAEQGGARCSATGRLTTAEGGCQEEGDALPVLDVIDDAIEDALRQGALVDVVEDESLRTQVPGLAALLRFQLRGA